MFRKKRHEEEMPPRRIHTPIEVRHNQALAIESEIRGLETGLRHTESEIENSGRRLRSLTRERADYPSMSESYDREIDAEQNIVLELKMQVVDQRAEIDRKRKQVVEIYDDISELQRIQAAAEPAEIFEEGGPGS